jgi:hypothetical protein
MRAVAASESKEKPKAPGRLRESGEACSISYGDSVFNPLTDKEHHLVEALKHELNINRQKERNS